jgi:hypothetical protein
MLYMTRRMNGLNDYPYQQILRKDMDLTGGIAETFIRNRATFNPTPPPGLTVEAGFSGYHYPSWSLTFNFTCYPDNLDLPVNMTIRCANGTYWNFAPSTLTFNGSIWLSSNLGVHPNRVELFGIYPGEDEGGNVPGAGYEFWLEVNGVPSNHVFICMTVKYGGGPELGYGDTVITPVYYTGTVKRITPLGIVAPERIIIYEQNSDCINYAIGSHDYYGGHYYGDPEVSIADLATFSYLEVDLSDFISNPVVIPEPYMYESSDEVYVDICNNYFAFTSYTGNKPHLYHRKEDETWEKITITVPAGYTAIYPNSWQYGWNWLYQIGEGEPSLIFYLQKDGSEDSYYSGYRLGIRTFPSVDFIVDDTTYLVGETTWVYNPEVPPYWFCVPVDPPVYHATPPISMNDIVISKDGLNAWYAGIWRNHFSYQYPDDDTYCRNFVPVPALSFTGRFAWQTKLQMKEVWEV